MRRLIGIFFALFAFLLMVTAQNSENGVLKQFQTFKWKPIARARKYEVIVQTKDNTGTWVQVESCETKDSRVEMLLLPGDYRVSISAFNVLNRRASTSPWVDFVILNETEPYFKDTIFTKDDSYGGYVLRRSQTTAAVIEATLSDAESGDAPAAVPVDNATTAETAAVASPETTGDDYEYQIIVYGRNIFFPETTFKMIPCDSPLGSDFTAMVQDRSELILPVISRDREQNLLTVGVDWDQLHSGYYRFEVKNPGGETDSFTVLVLPERTPAFEQKSFDYNRRYKTASLNVPRSATPQSFNVRGRDFQFDTVFSLVPSEGIPYPFASVKERVELPLTFDSCTVAGSNEMTLQFSFDTALAETGYYRLVAKTPGIDQSSLNILFDVQLPPETLPEIKKIKSKFDKDDKSVAFTVEGNRVAFTLQGDSLDAGSNAVLIAPCDEHGVNRRIPLMMTDAKKNGKKIIFEADSDMLAGGTYALMLETPTGTQITYIELAGGTFTTKMITMSQTQVEEKFLRSETLDDPGMLTENASKITLDTTAILTKEINDATFMNAKFWKKYSNSILFCYDKEMDGKNRLAMRFSGIADSWSGFSINTPDFFTLLHAGDLFRVTLYNDSTNSRNVTLILKTLRKPNSVVSDPELSYTVVVPPESVQTYEIPYRDFHANDGDIIGKFDVARVKSLDIRMPNEGKRRIEILDIGIYREEFPDGTPPLINKGWDGLTDNPNMSLENGELRLFVPLNPSNNYDSSERFANYTDFAAQHIRNADGISFSVRADREEKWRLALVQSGDAGWSVFEKEFIVQPEPQTIVLPYASFVSVSGNEKVLDLSRLCGVEFRRHMDRSAAMFSSEIFVSEMMPYGNGTYVAPENPMRAIPGFDSTDGWRTFFWDNAAKTSTSVPVPAEMKDGKIIFTADSVSYDWNSLCFSMQNNAEANAVLATADGIQFDALYTGNHMEAAHWRCRIMQKADDGTDVYFVKSLSLRRGKTTHVVLPYEDFRDSYIGGISGAWTKTNAYPFDRSKICAIEFEAQRRDGTQTPTAKTFSTQLALSNVREYKDPVKIEMDRPILMTAITLTARSPIADIIGNFPQYSYGIGVRLVDFNWVSFDAVYEFDVKNMQHLAAASLRLCIPSDVFRPYIGGGYGILINDELPQPGTVIQAFGGLCLGEFLDIRYNCNMLKYSMFDDFPDGDLRYFEDSISIGLQIRLRKPKPKAPIPADVAPAPTVEPAPADISVPSGQSAATVSAPESTTAILPVAEDQSGAIKTTPAVSNEPTTGTESNNGQSPADAVPASAAPTQADKPVVEPTIAPVETSDQTAPAATE